MTYFFLCAAIISEVVGTSALKASEEFTRPLPSALVVVGYGLSFYLLTLVLRSLPIGVTYAIWSGVGILLVAVIGAAYYREGFSSPRPAGDDRDGVDHRRRGGDAGVLEDGRPYAKASCLERRGDPRGRPCCALAR